MSREVAWAIVFLSGEWSQYCPGDVIVVLILGWTKFELLEKIKFNSLQLYMYVKLYTWEFKRADDVIHRVN